MDDTEDYTILEPWSTQIHGFSSTVWSTPAWDYHNPRISPFRPVGHSRKEKSEGKNTESKAGWAHKAQRDQSLCAFQKNFLKERLKQQVTLRLRHTSIMELKKKCMLSWLLANKTYLERPRKQWEGMREWTRPNRDWRRTSNPITTGGSPTWHRVVRRPSFLGRRLSWNNPRTPPDPTLETPDQDIPDSASKTRCKSFAQPCVLTCVLTGRW